MTKPAGMSDEEYVRSRWDAEVELEDHRLCCGTSEWRLVILDVWTHWNESPSSAWSAAAQFTEQREREIAGVEEEVVFMGYVARSAPQARILARLEAALADLRRGWRE